jgi:hypothetical protein
MSETRILMRRDSAENWYESNPILSNGEMGYCTDTRQVKIGNGTSRWNSLSHTYNPIFEGSVPYSVILTRHSFLASGGVGNADKTDIKIFGVFPASVPSNIGVSAFLYVSTAEGSRRLLRKAPMSLDGAYSITITFANLVSNDMVYLGNYTVEVLGETQELIGRYTFTYRPVLNALKLDLFFVSEKRARIQIYNPITITSGSVVVRRRSDLTAIGVSQTIKNLPPVVGSAFNTITYNITNTAAFLDGIGYFCELNYDTVNDLYANSEVATCSIQNIPANNVSFNPDNSCIMGFQIKDGSIKINSLSVFLCNSAGGITDSTALATFPIPVGGLLEETTYTMTLRRTLLHEEYYLFQYEYSYLNWPFLCSFIREKRN